MSDPFALVSPGTPLAINATAWNLVLAGARERAGRGRGPNADDLSNGRPTPTRILVHNSTGSNFPQWAIVSVGAPTFIPASSSEILQAEYAYTAAAPTAGGLFAVCQEAIPAGAVGFAVIQGVTPCTLNITATGDTHADATTSTTELTTGTSGRAEILYKASGTGAGKIGVVLVTNSANPGGSAAPLDYDSFYMAANIGLDSGDLGSQVPIDNWIRDSDNASVTEIEFPSDGYWELVATIAGVSSNVDATCALVVHLDDGTGATMVSPVVGGCRGLVSYAIAKDAIGFKGAGSCTLHAIFEASVVSGQRAITLDAIIASTTSTLPLATVYASAPVTGGAPCTTVSIRKLADL